MAGLLGNILSNQGPPESKLLEELITLPVSYACLCQIHSLIHLSSFLPIGLIPKFGQLLAVLLMAQTVLGNPSTANRINYGTIFEQHSNVYFSSEHWTHTYIFKLERPEDLNPFWPACNCTNNNITFHPDFKYVLYQLEVLHNQTITDIDKIIDNIFEIVPSYAVASYRKKRSLLPFIGTISKNLFGLATTEDIKKIANYINTVQRKQNIEIKGFIHEIDILHSFMSASDARINNIIKGVKENNMVLKHMNQELHANFEKLQEKNSIVMSIIVDQLYKSQRLSQTFSNLMSGIHSLMQNQLTTEIIPYSILANTLSHVETALKSKRPGFQLLFKDPNFYYRHNTFFFYRHDNKIILTLKFPIGKLNKPMKLHKIYSYPVPVNSDSEHATSILNLPAYVATSHDLSYYVEITNDIFNKCQFDCVGV